MKRTVAMGIMGIGLLFGAQAQAAKRASAPKVAGVVNLNKATAEELKMLPGVKEKEVASILAHREKHPFSRAEDLVNVKGFSKKRYERIKPFLAVGGDTTIHKLERKALRKAERKAVHKVEKQIKKAVVPHHHDASEHAAQQLEAVQPPVELAPEAAFVVPKTVAQGISGEPMSVPNGGRSRQAVSTSRDQGWPCEVCTRTFACIS